MDISRMKNMIILKNLPSNLADEAIIVLKENLKVKNKDLVDKKGIQKSKTKQPLGQDNYIIKEAECIVSEYLSKIDKNSNVLDKNINRKYKKMKTYSKIVTALAIVSIIINFIK